MGWDGAGEVNELCVLYILGFRMSFISCSLENVPRRARRARREEDDLKNCSIIVCM